MLLEYLKVLLAWPVVVGLLAVSIIRVFKIEIADAIGRITNAEVGGQKLTLANRQRSEVEPAEDAISEAAMDSDSDVVQPGDLDVQLPPELADDPNAAAVVDWISKNPAQTLIEYKKAMQALNFERAFQMIYGSQIELLEYLNNKESAGLGRMLRAFRVFQDRTGNTAYSQHAYLKFLRDWGLIQSVEGQAGRTSITPKGRDFLTYIKEQYPIQWNQKAA